VRFVDQLAEPFGALFNLSQCVCPLVCHAEGSGNISAERGMRNAARWLSVRHLAERRELGKIPNTKKIARRTPYWARAQKAS
jgi:hypothetical protein